MWSTRPDSALIVVSAGLPLISIVHAGAGTSPANLLSRTMADLDLLVGNTPQHDDMTCLLIKCV